MSEKEILNKTQQELVNKLLLLERELNDPKTNPNRINIVYHLIHTIEARLGL